MARTLARLEHMPDSSRSLASSRDAIKTLINMANSEDEEEVDAAILALKNLSTAPTAGVVIADCIGLEVPFTMHKFENLICFSLVKGGKELRTLEKNERILERNLHHVQF